MDNPTETLNTVHQDLMDCLEHNDNHTLEQAFKYSLDLNKNMVQIVRHLEKVVDIQDQQIEALELITKNQCITTDTVGSVVRSLNVIQQTLGLRK